MKLLVLTHPRGGEQYGARFFQSLGYNIKPGQINDSGGIVSMLVQETPEFRFRDFDVVLHQVRNPLDCLYNIGTLDYRTTHVMSTALNKFLPPDSIDRNERIRKGLMVWKPWNALCESAAHLTYRVEELRPGTDTLMAIAALLGFDPEIAVDVPTQWDRQDVALTTDMDSLIRIDAGLAVQTEEMATRYGYNL